MRSFASFMFSVIVTCCLFPPSVQALDIIYPADKTAVQRSDFLVIKGEDPALDALVIDINGVASDPFDIGDEAYKTTFADFLILEPEWSIGKNAVRITGFVAGKPVVTKTADIFFSPLEDPLTIIPAGYKPFVMHTAAREAICAPCHNMYPTVAQLRNATVEDNPCGTCHRRMLEKAHVHGPEGVFQCIDCHDSKNKEPRWQVTKTEMVLCGECHIDKIEEFKKDPFIHGPVALGECTICHNPHAAAEPAQLNAPINQLCGGCHSSIRQGNHVVKSSKDKGGHPLAKVKDPISPERLLRCTSCHNPHSGKSANLFIRNITGRFTLCQECHKK